MRLIERQKSLEDLWQDYQNKVEDKPVPLIHLPSLSLSQAEDPLERLKIHHQWMLSKSIVQQSLYYRLPPYVINEPWEKTDPDKTFHSQLENFLMHPSEKALLLLGPAGAGKSVETYWVLDRVLKEALWIPIRIELKRFTSNTVGHCVTNTLKDDYQFSEDQIQALKHSPCLIILDGYDEIGRGAEHINLYDSNQLSSWKNSKVIITCRSQYYQSDMKQKSFAPEKELLNLSVWHLAPLDKKQIKTYIQKQENFEAESCLAYIKSQPQPEALFSTPLTLRLLVEAWPNLQKNLNEKLTRFDLYEAFFHLWEEREEIKWVQTLGEIGLKTEQEKKYEKLVDLFKAFSERLALALYAYPGEEQQYVPEVDSIWQAFFSDTDPRIVKMRAGCPLVRKGHIYEFLHKSFGEHLVARQLWRALSEEHWNELLTLWSLRYFVDERLILEILIEQLKCLPKRCNQAQQLFEMIELSKDNPNVGIAASNAITLMNAAGFQLIRKNFEGVHLPKADLSYGCFFGTYFNGGYLPEVNFRKTDLRESGLRRCVLSGVKFGERPYLKLTAGVESCVFSPDGRYLAVAVHLEIILYKAAKGKRWKSFKGHTSAVTSVHLSMDGKWLASGSRDGTCRLWHVRTGACHQVFRHNHPVRSVHLSTDSKWLASGSDDKTCRLWHVESGACQQMFQGHTHGVESVHLSSNGKWLVSGSRDLTCRLWHVESGACQQVFQGHTSSVESVYFSSDGKWLASGGGTTCRLWHLESGMCQQVWQAPGGVRSVHFSSDGKWLASGSGDGTCHLWDAESGAFHQVFQGHYVTSVYLSSDGKWLASGSWDGTCRLWHVEGGACQQVFQGHTSSVEGVYFSSDGKWLASGGGTTCRLWHIESGSCHQVFEHTKSVYSVHFSFDGKWLASGGWDGTCRLWHVETGECRQVFQGHTREVNSVHLSMDGKWLVSGSGDQTCRLWDVERGHSIQVIKTSETINSIALNGSWSQLVIGAGRVLQRFEREAEGQYELVWSSQPHQLILTDCQAQDAIGLTEQDQTLLSQRGANASFFNSKTISPTEALSIYMTVQDKLKKQLFKEQRGMKQFRKRFDFPSLAGNYFQRYGNPEAPFFSQILGKKTTLVFWDSRFFKGIVKQTLSHQRLYKFLKSEEDFTASDLVLFFEGLKIYSARIKESQSLRGGKIFTKEKANQRLLEKITRKLQALYEFQDMSGLFKFYLKVNPYLILVHQKIFEKDLRVAFKKMKDQPCFDAQITILSSIFNKPYEFCSKEEILIFFCLMEKFDANHLALEIKKIETLLSFMVSSEMLGFLDVKYEKLLPVLSQWIKNIDQQFEKLTLQENLEYDWNEQLQKWEQLALLQRQAKCVLNTVIGNINLHREEKVPLKEIPHFDLSERIEAFKVNQFNYR